MRGGWAYISNGYLFVRDYSGTKRTVAELHYPIVGFWMAVDRYWLCAWQYKNGKIELKFSADGRKWANVPTPEMGGIEGLTLHPSSGNYVFTDTQSSVFSFFDCNRGEWEICSLPKGAEILSRNTDGEWWAAGSKQSSIRQINTEVALWRHTSDSNNGWNEIPVRCSLWDKVRTIEQGGFEGFRALSVRNNFILAASQCAWFFDDTSWFVFFLKKNGKFIIQKLKNINIAKIRLSINGDPLVYSTDGDLWQFKNNIFVPSGWSERISSHLSLEAESVVSLCQHEQHIYGFYSSDLKSNIPILSLNGGVTWQKVDFDHDALLAAF